MSIESSNHEEEFENKMCDAIGVADTCCAWWDSILSQGTCFQASTRTNIASHTRVFQVVWVDNEEHSLPVQSKDLGQQGICKDYLSTAMCMLDTIVS